jgi:arylsulfatase A
MNPARRQFLTNCALAGAGLALSPGLLSAQDPSVKKPNIVFILADDLGIDALGSYGGDDFKTPILDGLAAKGVRFAHAYCTPVCGPTRAQLQTGQYPFRNGALDIDQTMNHAKPDRCPSLAAMMKSAGYVTGMTGKWKQMRLDPGDWGYDERLVSPTSNGYYWGTEWSVNGEAVKKEEEVYFPDVMSDFALDFIRKHKSEPFFFYYALTHPHTTIVRTPDTKEGETDPKQLYRDNIAYLDKLVGRVVDELDKQGIRDNTVLIFTGDNGSLNTYAGSVQGRRLDGSKANMREGGAHVPFIVSWPAVIKQGSVCDELIDFTDVFPTFAELAGGKLPTDKGELDGRSFAPLFKGEKWTPREWVFVQLGQEFWVRDKRYRLDQDGALSDMSEAPFAARKIEDESATAGERAARERLQKVLDKFNPKGAFSYEQWKGFGTRRPAAARSAVTPEQAPQTRP